jgi:tryptophanyl-tRNA synthetase
VTDSGREITHAPDKPGISNLIEIMSVATGEPMSRIEEEHEGLGYGAFKDAVAESVVALLEPFQARFREIRNDPVELDRLLALGADKAREASAPTLERMYERMGFARGA